MSGTGTEWPALDGVRYCAPSLVARADSLALLRSVGRIRWIGTEMPSKAEHVARHIGAQDARRAPMRLLCASPYTLLLLLISTHGSDAQPAEIVDLDLTNFDTYLAEHETVLVHFWAPCAHLAHTLIPAPFPSGRLRFPLVQGARSANPSSPRWRRSRPSPSSPCLTPSSTRGATSPTIIASGKKPCATRLKAQTCSSFAKIHSLLRLLFHGSRTRSNTPLPFGAD